MRASTRAVGATADERAFVVFDKDARPDGVGDRNARDAVRARLAARRDIAMLEEVGCWLRKDEVVSCEQKDVLVLQ